MIRPATHADMPRLVEIMQDAHTRSVYAGTDVEIDLQALRRVLSAAIARHGHVNTGGAFAGVGEKDGKVEALIIGILSPIMEIGTKLYATDLFFVATDAADPRDPGKLMDAFIAWARRSPKCRQITMGVHNAIGDVARTEKLYQRRGFACTGKFYQIEVSP